MLLAIDPGDLMKLYAKAMENLCGIYDGSKCQGANGYHICQVTAANLEYNKIVPQYCEASSSTPEDYPGSSEKLMEIITKVKAHIGQKGTWAIGRQGDVIDLILFFTNEQLQFVTRLTGILYWYYDGNTVRQVKAERLHHHVKLKHKAHIHLIKDGTDEFLHLKFGAVIVALPEHPECWYTLVIIEGFGKQPMLLLNNKQININSGKQLWEIVDIYLTRWKCDECYRYQTGI